MGSEGVAGRLGDAALSGVTAGGLAPVEPAQTNLISANTLPVERFSSLSLEFLHTPWYRSLPGWFGWEGRRLAPLDVTSKPIPVVDIWGAFDYRRRGLLSSSAAHAGVLLLLFTSLTRPPLQGIPRGSIDLVIPVNVVALTPNLPATPGTGGSGEENPKPAPRFELSRPQRPGPQYLLPPSRLEPEPLRAALVLPPPGNPLADVAPPGPWGAGGISGSESGTGRGGDGGIKVAEDPTPVYKPGDDVSPPTLEFQVDPQYTEQARRQRLQGAVLLAIEVWPDGRAHRIRVHRGLGLGLDERAVDAVGKWLFTPGKKDGKPVRVAAMVEVTFQLF